jgi:hypothetical protein
MAGSASVPNTFATQSGNVPASQLDADWTALVNYINAREIGFGPLASRPAAGTHGSYWFATDALTLYGDNGSAWIQLSQPANAGLSAVGSFTPAIFF